MTRIRVIRRPNRYERQETARERDGWPIDPTNTQELCLDQPAKRPRGRQLHRDSPMTLDRSFLIREC